ncbi:MAG: hypothetical protein ACRCTE_12435 [Cellulosilyticaceae bacterium]
MAKIMSVLEKYKFIEKEAHQTPDTLPPTEPSHEPVVSDTPIDSEEPLVENTLVSPSLPEPPQDEKIVPEPTDTTLNYDYKLPLDAIYTHYAMNVPDVTRTVFVLENLMNALPSELPEYVKKSTLQNIIIASAMNLDQLLEDGMKRSTILRDFSSDYTEKVDKSIIDLKSEIAKLSAIINDYQQQIKNKELLQQEQMQLVKSEATRLQDILTFFEE